MINDKALAILSGQTPSQQFSSVQGVGDTCLHCPDNTNFTEPCDITQLSLIVLEGDKTHQIDIHSSRSVRSVPTLDLPDDNDKYQFIHQYDGILEVVAPIYLVEESGNAGLLVTAAAQDLSIQCPKVEHPFVQIKNVNAGNFDELSQPVTAIAQSIKPFEVYAKRLPIDSDVGNLNLADAFYMFTDTQGAQHVKHIEVTAKSCGVRDDGSMPNKTIKGLIRFYREDKYQLSIVLPKKVLLDSSFSVEKDAKGKVTKVAAKKNGQYLDAVVMDEEGNITKLTEQQNSLFTTTDTELTSGMELTEESQLREFVTFTRNGKPLGAISTINNILKIRKLIIEGVNFVDELTKKLPKAGFRWGIGLDLFAGKLIGEWGIQSGSSHDSENYQWVSPYGLIKADMSLITFRFEAYFGIEYDSPDLFTWLGKKVFELIAMIELTATIDVNLNRSFDLVNDNSDESDDDILWLNKATANVDFRAQFKVNVYGVGVDAGGGVDVGFEVDCKVKKPFSATIKVTRKKAYLRAYFVSSKRKETKPWTKKICDEKVIVEETPFF